MVKKSVGVVVPKYDYKCTICDERFEIEQSMKAKTLTKLKGDDHEHKLKKVFSSVGISFKGSGFYKNDSQPKKAGSSSDSASEKASDSGSSDTKSSDSKSSDSKSSDSGSKSSDSGSKSSSESTSPTKKKPKKKAKS